MHSTIRRAGLVLALTACVLSPAVQAQDDYPTRPVKLIVPIAPGSVTDVVLRAATPALGQQLGQPIVVENRPGASGIDGAEACAKAPADGYTLCAVYHATMSFNPFMFEKLPYDPARDFTPINRLFYVTEGLVVPAALPVRSVAELRAYAKAHPDAVNFGTLGSGSLQELLVAWLNREWGTRMVGVPYKGGGPIANAVTAGEIQLAQMGLGNFIGLIQSGQLRAIAVAGAQRSPQLPDVPTMAESGLGGFPSRPWWGIAAPAGTPSSIVARIHRAFTAVFQDPKMVEVMQTRYVESALDTPEQFVRFLAQDRQAAGMLVELARVPKQP